MDEDGPQFEIQREYLGLVRGPSLRILLITHHIRCVEKWEFVLNRLEADPMSLNGSWMGNQKKVIDAYFNVTVLNGQIRASVCLDLQYHDIRPDKGLLCHDCSRMDV